MVIPRLFCGRNDQAPFWNNEASRSGCWQVSIQEFSPTRYRVVFVGIRSYFFLALWSTALVSVPTLDFSSTAEWRTEKIARNWDRGNDPYGDPSTKGTKKKLQELRGSGTTLPLMGGTNTDIGTDCHE